jgi:hypothetical protein
MEILWLKLYNIKLLPFGVTIIDGELPNISYFAGGFVSGLLLLLLSTILFLRLYKKKRQELFWWFFTITLAFSFAGFAECIFEGFFLEYHRGILETIILSFFVFIFAPLLSLWHYQSNVKKFLKSLKARLRREVEWLWR